MTFVINLCFSWESPSAPYKLVSLLKANSHFAVVCYCQNEAASGRRGLEIIFAVDTSRSMLTPDVKPDRLTRAKLAVHDFVNRLEGDGVGLVAFAGNAFLQCPITLGYDAFRESLDALDTSIIPRGGTDIASAIRETQAALQNRASSDKILVLLTAGEDV